MKIIAIEFDFGTNDAHELFQMEVDHVSFADLAWLISLYTGIDADDLCCELIANFKKDETFTKSRQNKSIMVLIQ